MNVRANKEEAGATSGQSRIVADFEEIGWAPVPNAYHDIGTDLLIGVRDRRRFDQGLVVGAQAKSGESYFKSEEINEQGIVVGWWYYENDVHHFDAWVTHGFPHLVVLHDPRTRTSYWVHVTAERCEKTGNGYKILVPRSQIVCSDQAESLFAVAATQRMGWTFEGRAFDAGVSNIEPGSRLRYAVLTPRLVAPHGNSGFDREPEAEEALAILVKHSFSQYQRFVEKHPQRFAMATMATDRDWRWRLVHAMLEYLDNQNIAPLEGLLDCAPTSRERTVVRAILSAEYVEREEFPRALDILGDSDNDLLPIDRAWILTHRARIKVELGRIPEARLDAAQATKDVQGARNDPTASLIFGAAATMLFMSAEMYNGDSHSTSDQQENYANLLKDTINARDSAAAWWRGQTMASALSKASMDTFTAWAGREEGISLNDADEAGLQLQSLRLAAGWSADREAWCNALNEEACYHLARTNADSPASVVTPWLDAFRRCGEKRNLERTARRLWATGPILVLREASDRARPATLTRSSALPTFSLWEHAADAMSEARASEAANWCIALLRDSDKAKAFHDAFHPTFLVPMVVADALVSLIEVADGATQEEAARLLLVLPEHESALSNAIGRLALKVSASALRTVGLDALRAKAMAHKDARTRAPFLAAIRDAGDAESGERLTEYALAGDWAVWSMVLSGRLDAPQVAKLSAYLVARVEKITQDARANAFSSRAGDFVEQLTYLAVKYGDANAWESVLALFADPKIPLVVASGAIHLLANSIDEIDATQRLSLAGVLPQLTGPRFHNPMLGAVSNAPKHLAISLETDSEKQKSGLHALLSGDVSDRRLAAAVLGRGLVPTARTALHFLISDADVGVRRTAAEAVGRLCGTHELADWLPVVERIVHDVGVAAPLGWLAGVSAAAPNRDPELLAHVKSLENSPSHRVRTRAETVLKSA